MTQQSLPDCEPRNERSDTQTRQTLDALAAALCSLSQVAIGQSSTVRREAIKVPHGRAASGALPLIVARLIKR